MLSKLLGQERIPTGSLKQVQSVQGLPTVANSGSLSNTPMWFDYSDINSSTAAMGLGLMWCDQTTGNWYRYIRAAAALTPGQFVGFEAPTTGTVTASGSTVYVVKTNITTTAAEAGNYIWFLDAVGTYSAAVTPFSQALRLIKSTTNGAGTAVFGTNTIFTLSQRGSIYGNNAYDPDPLNAVPTNGSACCVIRPYRGIVATASTPAVGVALGEVTSGNYTIIQIAGLAMIQGNSTIGNFVVGKAAVMQAAGIASGPTSGTMTAANLDTIVGNSIYPIAASASNTTSLYPAYINFLGT